MSVEGGVSGRFCCSSPNLLLATSPPWRSRATAAVRSHRAAAAPGAADPRPCTAAATGAANPHPCATTELGRCREGGKRKMAMTRPRRRGRAVRSGGGRQMRQAIGVVVRRRWAVLGSGGSRAAVWGGEDPHQVPFA
uniref:Uncharacterized protein n=1 Tax=Oryza sativa subsp. japonica TaxID=39947 RepID=Q688R8_ORYSJ|nr:hypothetical protein [Oryza sativa Japonica Group]AAV31382.1 hypothetical protein [Oryza sativa Japonica Group]